MVLWEIHTRREIVRLDGRAHCVAISPDSRHLLSADWGTGFRLWDLRAALEIARFEESIATVEAVSFSPDGRHAVSSHRLSLFDPSTVVIWEFDWQFDNAEPLSL